MSAWLNKTFVEADLPVRVQCKQAPHLLDWYLVREPNAKSLWQHTEMMVFHMQLIVPFVTPDAHIFRQSESPEAREIGRRFAPLWEVLSPKLQEIFPDKDATGNFVAPALVVRAQVLNIFERRNGF